MTQAQGHEEEREHTPERHAFDSTLKRRIVRSSAWVGVGFGGSQAISFISTLTLARLLDPHAFGTVAVGMTLLAIISQVQESGLGAALIHGRKHDPEVAASTVLVFAALAGFALTAITIGLAPLYTHLLHVPQSTAFVQVLALSLAIRGLTVAPSAILEREIDFRSRTRADLSGATLQLVLSIACAVVGLGAWSLVAGYLAGNALTGSMLWLRAPWRPSPFRASRSTLREMLRYGRFVSVANVLVIVNTNVDNATVARFLGASSLGVYNVAWRLAALPNTFIGLIIGRVMFSIYSRLQHDLAAVRAAYLENLQRTMLLALPVTVTFGLGAKPIVLGLLGAKWGGAVDPLRVLAVYSFVRLVSAPSGELFKGIGRPHLPLFSAFTFLATGVPSLLVLVPRHGPTGAAVAMLIGTSFASSVSLALTFSAISLHPLELARSLARPVGCAVLVGAAVLATLPVTHAMGGLVSFAVVGAAATVSFAAALALVGRPLVVPIWAALRGS
jgi:O-antigen/teichoic acid export membrane protein